MHLLNRFNQLPLAMSALFVLIGGLALGLMLLQTGQFAGEEGQKQAQKQVRQLSAMAADLIQQRTAIERRVNNGSGLPSQDMLSRNSNAAAQSFPGQIVLLEEDGTFVYFSTLEQSRLDILFDDILKNRTQNSFTLADGDKNYLVSKQDLAFDDNTVEGFFMVRQGLLMAPYEAVQTQSSFFAILGALLLAFAGFVTGKLIASKLGRVEKVVVEAEQGDKPEPLNESGTQEFARLAKALNILIQGPSAKDKVRQEANTDPLTGLLNRRGFVQAMDDKFAKGGGAAEMSVIFMDLDGFKPINDTYGHDVGDDILREVAKRLHQCTREEDVICRLGGDEFVLLFPGLKDRKVLEERADRVLSKINDPYWIEDTRVTMGVSLGISIGPDDGKTGEELLQAADEAMYAAKKTGKNQFTFYS